MKAIVLNPAPKRRATKKKAVKKRAASKKVASRNPPKRTEKMINAHKLVGELIKFGEQFNGGELHFSSKDMLTLKYILSLI